MACPSEHIRAYCLKHGAAWRADVRDWWFALADAWEDGELHVGGACQAHPCLVHDKIARHADHERRVYSRAKAVAAYREWQKSARESAIDAAFRGSE